MLQFQQFQRVEAASLSIEELLNSIFGPPSEKIPDLLAGDLTYSPDIEPSLGLEEYRSQISDLDQCVQLNSTKIASLKNALYRVEEVQEMLERRRDTLASFLERVATKPAQLPTEIIWRIFSYAFPTISLGKFKDVYSNPWIDVILRTTLIDVTFDDGSESRTLNESEWMNETLSSTAPAAINVVMKRDYDYSTSMKISDILSPHFHRCRSLMVTGESHGGCKMFSEAVRDLGPSLRLTMLTINLMHIPCIMGCLLPSLRLLRLEESSYTFEDPTRSLVLILKATPNLRTLSVKFRPTGRVFERPCFTTSERISLPTLQRIRVSSQLDLLLPLIGFLSDSLEAHAVRRFDAEFGQDKSDFPHPLPSPETLIKLLDEKYPLITHLSLRDVNGDGPNSKLEMNFKMMQSKMISFINSSTEGETPVLRHLGWLSTDASTDLECFRLFETLARSRFRNTLTDSISYLELHETYGGPHRRRERFQERIRMYFPNIRFVVGDADQLRLILSRDQ